MRIKVLVFAMLALGWGAFSHQASAQTINCASQDGGRQFCPADTRGGVTMVKQNSSSPCVQGQTWGYDGRGIWVDRGCRATFRVSAYGYNGPGWWNSGPGRPPTNQPRNGACFFRQTNYASDYFCMERGASFGSLPNGFNDQISSIRIHGGATVVAFSDGNFSGGSVVFRHNVPDLRNYRVQGSDNKDWNNRISSIRVN